MKSILDPSFKYVPAAQTDIAKTFARLKAEEKAKAREGQKAGPATNNLALVKGQRRA